MSKGDYMRWIVLLSLFVNMLFAQCVYTLNITADLPQNTLHVNAVLKDNAKSVVADFERFDIADKEALYQAIRNGANVLNFKYTLQDKETITPDFIMQLGEWTPLASTLCTYDVHVTLPQKMTVVSEANQLTVHDDGKMKTWHFVMDKPIDHITLVASTEYVTTSKMHRGVELTTYFFAKHASLAEAYLQKSAAFLDLYTSLLGPFPYKRFAIVENHFQTGYSMPTYTLIGDRLLGKPYLIERSLGHEMVHQWFGNGLFVHKGSGNWSEGLTTWLSDLRVAKEKSESIHYRHEAIQTYMLETHKEKALEDFLYRYDKESKTLGYDKGMFLWEMLSDKIGEEKLLNLLRQLVASRLFSAVGYDELATFFMKNAPEIEPDWFSQWIKRKGIASFKLTPGEVLFKHGKYQLPLTIMQDTKDPYRLSIPLHVSSDGGDEKRIIRVNETNTTVILAFDKRPFALSVDPERKLFRKLFADEVRPNLAMLLHSDALIVVGTKKPDFLPQSTLVAVKDLTMKMLEENDVLFLEEARSQASKFVGLEAPKGYEWAVRLESNPWAKGRLTGVMVGESPSGIKYRLKYYSAYSELGSYKGQMLLKNKPFVAKHRVILEEPQVAVIPSVEESMGVLLPSLHDKRVVMVGESHTNQAHHANQLRIVKAMFEQNPNLVIALEMIQKPFQKYLDQYSQGEIDLFTMLEKTEYYKRWKYDMYFYVDIFEYAKTNGIALLAMNQSKEITNQTTKEGIASLDATQQASLPSYLDFSNEAYEERLSRFFKDAHGKESKMKLDSTRLYQSQIIWDETMADTVFDYLKEHPQTRAVVLVGSGHLRYRDGIPSRLERRLGEKPFVIVQDMDPVPGVADRVIMSAPLKGVESPKLGVYLDYATMQVTKVIDDGYAKKIGMKKDDIITMMNGKSIKGIEDLKLALFKASYLEEPFVLHVKRGDKEIIF